MGHGEAGGHDGHGHAVEAGHGPAHAPDTEPGSEHGHGHGHGHGHEHARGVRGLLMEWLRPHSHDAADSVDRELEGSAEGIRAVKISLVALGVTAALQLVVALVSGSVALLADTIHNFSDALTALPLWLAFVVGRRVPTRRYTYGYGRAEDLAGVFVVLMIAASAVVAAVESVRRLADPQPVTQVGLVALAGLVGFAGNELVAVYRIRVGRRIGSAALVADGLHARTDGLTSLAVLVGAGGVALGWQWADPVIGLVITVAILVVLWSAARDIGHRLMDAVDPELVSAAERALAGTAGVEEVEQVRVRWVGHAMLADADIAVHPGLSLVEAHDVAERARHDLLHALPKLRDATLHVNPVDPHGAHHQHTAHHRDSSPIEGKRP